MNISLEVKKIQNLKTEAIVYGIFSDLSFNKDFFPDFKKEAEKATFKGNIGESFFYSDKVFVPQKVVLFVGLGKKEDYDAQQARKASSLAVRKLKERGFYSAGFYLHLEKLKGNKSDIISAITEGIILTNSKFQRYITDKEKLVKELEEAVILIPKEDNEFVKGLKIGKTLSESVLFARDLVTAPSNEITPEYIAEEAKSLAKAYGFKIKVMDENECKKMGMNAFLAVARGSLNPPKFIHISYKVKGAKKTIGFVGKGLTFDSGGISIKPSEGMGAMKSDMSGAAAVLGAMKAIGELKPKVNIEMVIAACENMPSGSSFRPGDVIKSMSGKTIEVQNTDAEGRLTLADALTYIQKQNVDEIIDLATLTGACVVALGTDIAGIMGNDDSFIKKLIEISNKTGESLWQLPLESNYKRFIKSPIADICNISRVRWGGAITAGLFLKFFVNENVKWAHIDIAGVALRDDDLNENHRAEGSGFGVRLLAKYALEN